MIVVSDTSPIINLAYIGRLDIVRQLYGGVSIPRAVFDEIAITGAGKPGAKEIQTLSWIETRQVSNLALARALQIDLDVGKPRLLH